MSQKSPQGLLVTKEPQGLVFVYLEAGADVEEADLNGTHGGKYFGLQIFNT
jgi:hypothetical protein